MEKSLLSLLLEEDNIVKEINFHCEIAKEYVNDSGDEFDNHCMKEYYERHIREAGELRTKLSGCRENIRDYIKMVMSK